MLDHDSIVPLYEQIMQAIRAEIHNGQFEGQKKLPTEEELSEKYKVSRITIRRAVSELAAQGLVEKKQGKGTFVCSPKLYKTLNHPGMSFTEICAANGMKASARILKAGPVTPEDPQVLEWLGLEKGQQAVRILRLRYADDRPLVVEDNHFPMEYAYLLNMDLEHDSIYRYLREEKGIGITAGELTLRLVRADARTARLLEVPRGTPMLRMAGCTRRTDGSILHTCHQVGYGEDFDFILR
ncbi:MAG: GntR family transcriptional regulator [Pygmaiobacter massiliensis]|jgi:GntR family transcriptional regulator|nr:GntR family transcriptional regulator [Pygmaiobacter massiliensis]